jgi:acetylornithine deacetylase
VEAVDHLRRLVALDTVSSRPVVALSDYMCEHVEALGFQVERRETGEPGKHNLIATFGPPRDGGLVLSGHMDVVPVDGQPWTSDPFRLTERDGRLVGRGTADMKGFLAATLTALERVDRARLQRELVLVWTCDEELGCLGSATLVDQLLAEGRPLPRRCVIGEPTDFRPLRMHPGHVVSELVFHGAAAHSSRPDLGVNAIEAAADAIVAIRELARRLEHERKFEDLLSRPWVTVNTGTIEGGSAVNIVPDRCVVRVGFRPLPGSDPEDLHERIAHAAAATGARFDARIVRVTPAMLTDAGSETWRLVAPHADHAHEGAATFATDGGNLAKLGLEPIVFGPGSIEVAHQADEWLARADLERTVDVVADVVTRACG